MAVELPSEVAQFLQMIGIPWINVNQDTDGMTPMTRVENGRKGALEEGRYAHATPGPNYGCMS